ncbi:DNA binding protein [Gordonia phage RoyalG]|uniref:DNA binding protein n=1 Tax=Gordonia phage RoyalG TaxID=2805837 RepID=A0A890UTR8_9CAUD|nr:DNA binding protein [Gordonia phage RoyalG]
MSDKKPNPILEMLKEKVAREEAEAAAKSQLETVESDAEVPSEFAEAAPDVWDDEKDWRKEKAERQSEEDDALKRLRIRDVYERLTGRKVDPKRSGGKNEILVFCPSADHDNSNTEAACINTVKNTWVCYGQCDDGGGVIDMVAAANGLPYGKASKGKEFAKAKQITLEEMCGWQFVRQGKVYVGKSPETQQREAEEFEATYSSPAEAAVEEMKSHIVSAKEVAKELGFSLDAVDDDLPSIGATKFDRKEFGVGSGVEAAKVRPQRPDPASLGAKPARETKPASSDDRPALHPVPELPESEEEEEDLDAPEMLPEIEGIFDNIPPDTPLYEFMYSTMHLATPKEFLLFRGLQLLALSAGAYVRGSVAGRQFKPSLACMFIASSGAGKSESSEYLSSVLEDDAYTWRTFSPPSGKYLWHSGLKQFRDPGSGEYLLQTLSQIKNDSGVHPIRDVTMHLDIDELAQLMSKGAIKGSSLITTIQKFDNSGGVNHSISTGSMGMGEQRAVNPNVIISAGTQAAVLGRLLGQGNIGNGLMARFEIVTGNRAPERKSFRLKPVNLDFAQQLYSDIAQKYLNGCDQAKRDLVVIPFNDECEDEFDRINYKMQKLKLTTDAKSRFDLKFRKMCLLFAINSGRTEIMLPDVHAAEWIMEYLDRTTSMTAEKTVTSEGNEMEDGILTAAAGAIAFKDKGYATEGDIWLRSGGKRKGWDRDAFNRKLERLIDRGELVVDPRTAARGPKGHRYVLPGSPSLKVVPNNKNKGKGSK